MKKWTGLFIGLVLSFCGIGQTITSITTIPSNPTSNDQVSLVVNTSLPTSGCWLTTSTVTSNGNNHDFFGAHCSGIAQSVCAGSDTFSMGILNPGTHNVDYTMYYGGLGTGQTQCTSFQYGDTMSYSFFVSNGGGVLPVEMHPQGEHHICQGDSFFFHTDGNAGQTFQWLYNGQYIPGATAISYWAMDSGFYQVRMFANGDSGTSPAQLLQVHDRPAGPLTLIDDVITVSANAVQHQWFEVSGGQISGADSSQVSVSTDGDYYVEMTNMFQCMGNSDTLYVEFIDAAIEPDGNLSICVSDSVTFIAEPVGQEYTYTWLRNGVVIPFADSSTYLPMSSGDYQVRVAISQSFDTSAATTLDLIPSPNPIISYDGTILESVSAWVTYQWYSFSGGLILGADSAGYVPDSNGIYYLIVEDSVGCTGISNSITIETLNAEDIIEHQAFRVYSVDESLILRFVNPIEASIKIYDLSGKAVKQGSFSGSLFVQEVSDLPASMYVLHVQTTEGIVYSKKVLID